MSQFALLEQDTVKAIKLPRNTLKNTLLVSHSILSAKTVNLNKVKDSVPYARGHSRCTESADYKLLTRYFDQGKLSGATEKERYHELMKGLQALSWLVLFGTDSPIKASKIKHLVLDGTKWELGGESVHLMTLCVLVGDVAIPFWWEDICKAGHSSQAERTACLDAAMKRYHLKGMILIADREYIGTDWFKDLESRGIYFVIRVKEGIYHHAVNVGSGLSWHKMKAKAKRKPKGKKVSKRIILEGQKLHYIIMKNPRPDSDDELIFMVSNWYSPTQAARMYEWRWQIEVCFKHLKSNGFNLEDINLQGKEKIHLMMAILVFVYTLAIKEGIIEELRTARHTHYKKDKRSGFFYRTVSVFRKGLSIIIRKAMNALQLFNYINSCSLNNLNAIFSIV